RCSHSLSALSWPPLAVIKLVYSHPQALAQCDVYLRRAGMEPVSYYDTAGSAKMIQEQRLLGCGAIASRRATQLYDLELLDEGIETNPNNYTKFLVIGTTTAPRTAQSKTSIVF